MIYIGADHAGYLIKEAIKKFLDKSKIQYIDVGTNNPKKNDDYPDYACSAEKVGWPAVPQYFLVLN